MAISFVAFIKGLLIQDPADRSKQLALTVSSSATPGTTTTIVSNQTDDRGILLPDFDFDMNVLAPVTANRVLQSNGSGNTSASSVTSTTLTYLDATSSIQTQLNSKSNTSAVIDIPHGGTGQTTANAALNALLPSQSTHTGQVLTSDGTNTSWAASGSGANVTLSNLGSTAVNTNINPDANNSHSLGVTGGQWAEVNTLRTINLLSPDVMISGVLTGIAGLTGVGISNTGIASFGITQNPIFVATINDAAANSVATGSVGLITGDKTAGTGDSGSIALTVGSSSGGTRGQIQFKDGTEGVQGDVWTSTDAFGNGAWVAGSGGGANTALSNLISTSVNQSMIFDGLSIGTTLVKTAAGSSAANSGPIEYGSGNVVTGASGSVILKSGGSPGGATSTGDVTITSGFPNGSGPSGTVSLLTSAGSGITGDVLLQTGATGGTRGTIKLQDGSEGSANAIWTSSNSTGSGNWVGPGASGSFTTVDSKTVTVVNGIITSIVP